MFHLFPYPPCLLPVPLGSLLSSLLERLEVFWTGSPKVAHVQDRDALLSQLSPTKGPLPPQISDTGMARMPVDSYSSDVKISALSLRIFVSRN